jgi:hypothetical protein
VVAPNEIAAQRVGGTPQMTLPQIALPTNVQGSTFFCQAR